MVCQRIWVENQDSDYKDEKYKIWLKDFLKNPLCLIIKLVG